MNTRLRRTVSLLDRPIEEMIEADEVCTGGPCRVRVRVMTRGLALILVVICAGLIHQTQSTTNLPAAFATYDTSRGNVRALVHSTDDRVIYGCNADGTHAAWDLRSPRSRDAAQGPYFVRALYAPDASKLAVVDPHGDVSVWDLEHWRRWVEIPPRGGMAKPLAFSRDCATLAVADERGVWLWEVTTEDPTEGPHLDLAGVSSLAFAPDGRTLAVGTNDGMVRFWDSAQGESSAGFRAHRFDVIAMAFTADGRKLVTCSHNDRIVRLWNVGGGGRLLQEFDGHSAIQAFALAPGDQELATAGFDGAVRLWDVATGEARWDFIEGDGPVTALAFSSNGASLACGVMGAIRLYRLD